MSMIRADRRLSQSRRAAMLALPLPVLALVAAFAAPAAAQTDDRMKTVIIAGAGQVNTLDPIRSDYAQTNNIDATLYDPLVTYDASGKIVGRLAKSFKQSDDVKSVEIELRSDVKFHDGTPITAKDVAYTLDRLKRLGSGIASQIAGYDSTTVADDTHLTIKLSKPYSLFLGALSKIYIVNSALVAANAGTDDGQAWLQSHEAGSGAFTLAGQEGTDTTVKLNPAYFDIQPGRPSTIIFRRIDESATKRDEMIAGNVDIAFNMGGRDIDAIAATPGLAVAALKTPDMIQILFNTRKGPTADPKVRKALRLAYDYAGGLKSIRSGSGSIGTGPLPDALPCRPAIAPAKQDFAEAKKLLKEAGQENLHLVMRFQPVFEQQKQEATLYQSNLAQIGVTVDLQPIAFPNYLASLKDQDQIPQVMLLEDFAQFPDPGVVLVKGYKSDAIGTNRTGYANPKVDKLLDEALASPDADKRCSLYEQVQTILNDDSVMADLYSMKVQIPYRKELLEEPKASPTVAPISAIDLRLANP